MNSYRVNRLVNHALDTQNFEIARDQARNKVSRLEIQLENAIQEFATSEQLYIDSLSELENLKTSMANSLDTIDSDNSHPGSLLTEAE